LRYLESNGIENEILDLPEGRKSNLRAFEAIIYDDGLKHSGWAMHLGVERLVEEL